MRAQKNYSFTFVLVSWIIFMPGILFSQNVIKVNDGREIEVRIISQTRDLLIFEKVYSPGVYHKILLSELDTIFSLMGPLPEDSPEKTQRIQIKYINNKRTVVAELGILAGGVVMTLEAGIYTLTGGVDEAFWGRKHPGIAYTLA